MRIFEFDKKISFENFLSTIPERELAEFVQVTCKWKRSRLAAKQRRQSIRAAPEPKHNVNKNKKCQEIVMWRSRDLTRQSLSFPGSTSRNAQIYKHRICVQTKVEKGRESGIGRRNSRKEFCWRCPDPGISQSGTGTTEADEGDCRKRSDGRS